MANFNINTNISGVIGMFNNFRTLLSGGVTQAVGAVNKALLTLAANPIGAVIAALGVAIVGLTAILRRFQPVIDLIDQGLAALSATFDVLADRIGFLFGVTEKNTLSFREAAEAAIELEKASQRLADAEIEQITVSAMRRAEFARARLDAADATKSDEERIAALDEAQRIQNEGIDEELVLRRERLRILREQQALGANDRADNEEAARLEAEIIDLDAMRLRQLRQTETQRSALIKRTQDQQAAEEARARSAAERAEEERQREEDDAQAEVDRIREIREQREIDLLIAGGATEEEVFQARLDRAETEEEMAQIRHEAEVQRIKDERKEKADAAAEEMRLLEEAGSG